MTGVPQAGDGASPARAAQGVVHRLMPRVEDALYVLVAVVLVGLSLLVLGSSVVDFATREGRSLRSGSVELLNDLLLILMLIEILHTVGISLRQHVLVPEPFLIVGLIAAIRRVLVLTAEQGTPTADQATAFRLIMLELGILAVLVVSFVLGLVAMARARRHYGALEGPESTVVGETTPEAPSVGPHARSE
jgi:uncharacterized membrane protein (DUF373 family)